MSLDDIKSFIQRIQRYNTLLESLSYKACFLILDMFEGKALLVGKDAGRFAGHIKNTVNQKLTVTNEIKTNNKSRKKVRNSYVIKMDP